MILLLAGIASIPSFYVLVAMIAVYGYFSRSIGAATSSLVARFIPSGRRGMGYAIFHLAREIAEAATPAIAGYIAQTYGIWNVFPLAIGLFTIGLLLFQRVLSRHS